MEFIGHILSKLDPDVLCLQETSCRMALFHWNYVCYRRDRPGRGGGLITLIKRGIQHDCFDISIPSMRGTVESMGVRINEDVSILNIYSPPSSRINFELFSLKRVGKFILAGDFNAHHRYWSKKTDVKGCDLLNWTGQEDLLIANPPGLATLPRHGTSPDLILHHEEIQLLNFELVGEGIEHGSDHTPLSATFDTLSPLEPSGNHATKRSVWDFNTADWYSYEHELDYRFGKVNNSASVGRRAVTFNRIVLGVAKRYVRRRLRIKGKRRRMWNASTPDTKRAKGKFIAERLAKGEGFAYAFKKIKDLETDEGREIHIPEFDENQLPVKFLEQFVKTPTKRKLGPPNTKSSDFAKIGGNLTMTELKRAIKKVRPGKAPGPDGIHGIMLKNLSVIGMDFLLALFNESWLTSKVPRIWKEGLIKPVYKPGKPKDKIASFRPITLTSVVGKVLERVIYDRLMYWLTQNNALSSIQAGFRRGRNTCEQISMLVNALHEASEKNKSSVLLSFDFTEAFDRINHEKLIKKMKNMRIPSPFIAWVVDFLKGRQARVSANGNLSSYRTVTRGVPQGSIIGPLLYLIYVDDLAKLLEKTGSVSALYADDTACVVSDKDVNLTNKKAQWILGLVDSWCKTNDMALSVSKTCGMPVRCPKDIYWRLGFPRTAKDNYYVVSRGDLAKMIRPNEFGRPILGSGETILKVDDTEVANTKDLLAIFPDGSSKLRVKLLTAVLMPMVDSVKYLGVHIDGDLSYGTQVGKMLDETRKGLALLGKLEQYDFDFKTLCMVKNLYILSRLSYGLESFGPFLSEGQIDLVDLNLKKIARRITGCSIYTRSLPLLLEANMLPMKLIIEKQARTALFRYRSLKWVRSTNRIAKGFWSSKLPQEDCNIALQGIVQPDSIEPWADVPNLEISCGYGHNKTGDADVDRNKFEEYCRDLVPCNSAIYVDGSHDPVNYTAGAAAVQVSPTERTMSSRLVATESSYKAEQVTLKLLMREIGKADSILGPRSGITRIFSDSKSNLEELNGGIVAQRKLNSLLILESIRDLKTQVHLQFIPAHVGIEPHDKADKLAKEVSKDAESKPVSTTMDFFAHKSRVARESHRKLIGKMMEASEKAKPPMKRVMLRQYLEATGGLRTARYPKDMLRASEVRIAQFRTGSHPLLRDKGVQLKCPFCRRTDSSPRHLMFNCMNSALVRIRNGTIGSVMEEAKISKKEHSLLFMFATRNLHSLAGFIWHLEQWTATSCYQKLLSF